MRSIPFMPSLHIVLCGLCRSQGALLALCVVLPWTSVVLQLLRVLVFYPLESRQGNTLYGSSIITAIVAGCTCACSIIPAVLIFFMAPLFLL